MSRFANVSLKKYHLQVLLPLMASLFISVFCRSDKTVVNELVLQVFRLESYVTLKEQIKSFLPLNHFLVYSLPEGLWVYSTTLVSKDLCIKFRHHIIHGKYFALIFSFVVEAIQGLGLVKGTFDLFDIAAAIFFGYRPVLDQYSLSWDTDSKNI
jgi:hypothetical protein